MHDRLTGTISSWKMNTGPQQFFHSTFVTHLAIPSDRFWHRRSGTVS